MFILSTLIISLYIILITGALIEIRTELEPTDLTRIGEVYRNFKNDIQYRAVVDLARATALSLSQSQLNREFEDIIIPQLVDYGLGKGIDASITLVNYEYDPNPPAGGDDGSIVTIEVIISIAGDDTTIQDRITAIYGLDASRTGNIVTIYEFVNSNIEFRPFTGSISGTSQNYGDGTYLVPVGPVILTLSNGVVLNV
ncbi:MAG: hypothetical protein ACFFCQ_00430 [Promethearchaeota archaeon]